LLVFGVASILLLGIFVLLVFGPDIIINVFRLDKGFDTYFIGRQTHHR
jgi:hypothetical protein